MTLGRTHFCCCLTFLCFSDKQLQEDNVSGEDKYQLSVEASANTVAVTTNLGRGQSGHQAVISFEQTSFPRLQFA